jgi:hypothetical protein
MRLVPLVLPLLLATACGRSSADDADSTLTAAPPDSVPSAPASDSGAWVARPDGIGPIRVGMTSAEARAATGLAEAAPVAGECAYLGAVELPHGVRVMLARDTVVRVETTDSTVATEDGARVGEAEARVTELYAGRMAVQPQKYEPPPAHVLVVTPPDDTTRRIIFLTDGARVTELRVGRMPEVAFVEGCG